PPEAAATSTSSRRACRCDSEDANLQGDIMSKIIAGGFETLERANAALQRLTEAGVAKKNLCTYRVNPPGMHGTYPLGGDRDKSPGAKHAEGGAAKGAAVGAAVGLAASAVMVPFLGPLGIVAGVGAGAYTGSL